MAFKRGDKVETKDGTKKNLRLLEINSDGICSCLDFDEPEGQVLLIHHSKLLKWKNPAGIYTLKGRQR